MVRMPMTNMRSVFLGLLTAIFAVVLVTACSSAAPEAAEEPLPTLIPLAALPEPTATSAMPPTLDI